MKGNEALILNLLSLCEYYPSSGQSYGHKWILFWLSQEIMFFGVVDIVNCEKNRGGNPG